MHVIQSEELKNFHMTQYKQQKEMQWRHGSHAIWSYPISEQRCGDIIVVMSRDLNQPITSVTQWRRRMALSISCSNCHRILYMQVATNIGGRGGGGCRLSRKLEQERPHTHHFYDEDKSHICGLDQNAAVLFPITA